MLLWFVRANTPVRKLLCDIKQNRSVTHNSHSSIWCVFMFWRQIQVYTCCEAVCVVRNVTRILLKIVNKSTRKNNIVDVAGIVESLFSSRKKEGLPNQDVIWQRPLHFIKMSTTDACQSTTDQSQTQRPVQTDKHKAGWDTISWDVHSGSVVWHWIDNTNQIVILVSQLIWFVCSVLVNTNICVSLNDCQSHMADIVKTW